MKSWLAVVRLILGLLQMAGAVASLLLFLQIGFAPIDWIDTRPREQAYSETGMQGNQNTAWKLRDKFTLDKLRAHFSLQD